MTNITLLAWNKKLLPLKNRLFYNRNYASKANNHYIWISI